MHIKLSLKPYNIAVSTAQMSELVKTIHEVQSVYSHTLSLFLLQ